MQGLKTQPVAVFVAFAGVLEAIIVLLMSLGTVSPEVGGSVTLLITGAITFVKKLVTPVEKVAVLLDKPVEVANNLLEKVKL